MAIGSTVRSSISFLKRDPLYDTEKPFENRIQYGSQIPKSNALLEDKDVTIQDIRGTPFSLETHGFYCLNLENDLSPEDYDQPSKVARRYLPQLAEAVKKSLGADRIQIFDFTRRKRHPDYPYMPNPKDVYEARQPAYAAHIDETVADAERVIKKLNPTDYESLLKRRWQVVIAWKPLRGPVRDWPLALCDVRSLDLDTDIRACDIYEPGLVSEEYCLHHGPQQKWYYLKDQMPNEVWVMLQSDSDGSIGVPHSAFPHPDTTEADGCRESVDARMLVFYEN